MLRRGQRLLPRCNTKYGCLHVLLELRLCIARTELAAFFQKLAANLQYPSTAFVVDQASTTLNGIQGLQNHGALGHAIKAFDLIKQRKNFLRGVLSVGIQIFVGWLECRFVACGFCRVYVSIAQPCGTVIVASAK